MADNQTAYPARLSVDYPDRPLNRLSTFFRLFAIIPIAIVMGLLPGVYYYSVKSGELDYYRFASTAYIFLPLVLMLLFRRKYPQWWYDWNTSLIKFGYRLSAYFLLMRDEYPSTDEEQAVHIDVPYPDAMQLNRWLPLVKWFLAIPHFVVLLFVSIGAIVAVIIAWFAILFTGKYPQSLFYYMVGFQRWSLRVTAYCLILTTDQYPPFRLAE